MPKTRLILALAALALVGGCNEEPAAGDGRSATGEVLEGTISDAMLPLDRVRSEPPLEDPEAFADAQSEAGEDAAPTRAGGGESDAEEDDAGDEPETPADEPAADAE